jgi:myo-inositol-1-phosphate synthase
MQKNIKVAIAGVGNCASALVQGVEYYGNRRGAALEGVMRPSIAGYSCGDIEFVAAFDAKSATPSRRRSSQSQTAPGLFKVRYQCRTSSFR